MKIIILGDPHGKISILGKTDLILCTGDLGDATLLRNYFFKYTLEGEDWTGIMPKKEIRKAYSQTINSAIRVIQKLGKTKTPVFLVLGNADFSEEETTGVNRTFNFKFKSMLKEIKKYKNIVLVNKKVIRFKGLKIAGLDFFREEAEAKKFLSRTKHLDILLTHNPPYKMLDKAKNKYLKAPTHVGSKALSSYIKSKKPRYLICGHIHESKGTSKLKKTIVINAGTRTKKVISL